MQIHTGKISVNANIDMQNLLQLSKESNVKLEKPTFFDALAAEVSFSKEGMSALREQQNQSEYMGYMESRELAMSDGTKYWIDNEIEVEYYFNMRDMSAQTLNDGNYDVKALDTAFQWRLSNLEGYITCQQTNDGSKFFSSANMKMDEAERKEYKDTAISIIERAKEKLLKMYEETDCKKGVGKSIIWNMMNTNVLFIEKTQQLFSKTIKNNA